MARDPARHSVPAMSVNGIAVFPPAYAGNGPPSRPTRWQAESMAPWPPYSEQVPPFLPHQTFLPTGLDYYGSPPLPSVPQPDVTAYGAGQVAPPPPQYRALADATSHLAPHVQEGLLYDPYTPQAALPFPRIQYPLQSNRVGSHPGGTRGIPPRPSHTQPPLNPSFEHLYEPHYAS